MNTNASFAETTVKIVSGSGGTTHFENLQLLLRELKERRALMRSLPSKDYQVS